MAIIVAQDMQPSYTMANGAQLHLPMLFPISGPGRDERKQTGKARMNWITNYVRPRINSLFSRREVPENLWTKCPECGTMLFHRELAENLYVCTSCDHHMPINPRQRFTALFDGGVFSEIAVPVP